MTPKVLVVEELHKKKYVSFKSYVTCCIILGYPYQVCHDRKELPMILEVFSPDIVFWIGYYEEKIAGVDYYEQMRQQYQNLRIVLAYDFSERAFPTSDDMADTILSRSSMTDTVRFQYLISELVLTNLRDKSATVKYVKFDLVSELSENALRAMAAEKMTPNDQSDLDEFTERVSKGRPLTEWSRQHLTELTQKRELLMQRKTKAVEILIKRGVTESVDELMNPKDNRPNYHSLDLLFPQ